MKKLLILVTMFIGYANAEIINLKCSNPNSDITIAIDIHEKVAWLDDFIPFSNTFCIPSLQGCETFYTP